MSDKPHHTENASVDSATTAPPRPAAAPPSLTTRLPRIRTGAAGSGISAAAFVCVVLIVFWPA